MDEFFKHELTASIKKLRDDPEIPKRLFFSFIFGLKKNKVQTYGTVL